MKKKFLEGRKKQELVNIAKNLGVQKYNKISKARLIKTLTLYPYKKLVQALRE